MVSLTRDNFVINACFIYLVVLLMHHCFLVKGLEFNSMDCDIYCSGPILHHVQMARIFNDSKYFVDMKMRVEPPMIKSNFQVLMNSTENNPSNTQLKNFVENNFEENTFENYVPEDWNSNPLFIEDIYDKNLRSWTYNINKIWKSLGRRLSEDVKENNSLYSYLYVPHPFIVPGGRFQEFYYWDSYWIIEGLLLSDMYETAENMLNNYIYLVKNIGYVPNGGRKYYLGRSQPPLLIPMCQLFFKATKNVSFLEKNLPFLEKEFNFWVKNRSSHVSKDGLQFRVFQYKEGISQPRPESYFEDYTSASSFGTNEKLKFYSAIRSATESGWDFSSRWFKSNQLNSSKLQATDTEAVVPVCLNSIIGYNARILSDFYQVLNNVSKSKEYKDVADEMNVTISRLFWNEELGTWLDYNLETKSPNPTFYLSNIIPLWAEIYGSEYQKSYIVKRVLNYIDKERINSYPGGIPTSLINSGQQWDYPNAWAPLQHFLVLGLEKAKHIDKSAGILALDIAKKWILNCYLSYESLNHTMFEKYDASQIGTSGGNGEYPAQNGFGWTNGVALKFMSLYRHKIRTAEVNDPLPAIVGCVLTILSSFTIVAYIYRVHKNIFMCELLKSNNPKTPHFIPLVEDYV